MACYPCCHCNKCGMYSTKAVNVCVDCGTEIGPGIMSCPTCGGKKTKTVMLSPGERFDTTKPQA